MVKSLHEVDDFREEMGEYWLMIDDLLLLEVYYLCCSMMVIYGSYWEIEIESGDWGLRSIAVVSLGCLKASSAMSFNSSLLATSKHYNLSLTALQQ